MNNLLNQYACNISLKNTHRLALNQIANACSPTRDKVLSILKRCIARWRRRLLLLAIAAGDRMNRSLLLSLLAAIGRLARAATELDAAELSQLAALKAGISAFLAPLPNRTRIVIDVGANKDPMIGRNNQTATIAFEPVVHAQLLKALETPRPGNPSGRLHLLERRLHVVPAAISPSDAFATMVLNDHDAGGQTSSLSAVASKGMHVSARTTLRVPLLSLASVIELIPPRLMFWLLKTDMQGHDAPALKSLSPALLLRPCYIQAEVALHGVPSYADGPGNDFCNDILPVFGGSAAAGGGDSPFRLIALQNLHLNKYGATFRGDWTAARAACSGEPNAGVNLGPVLGHKNVTGGGRNEVDVFIARREPLPELGAPYAEFVWPCLRRNQVCKP